MKLSNALVASLLLLIGLAASCDYYTNPPPPRPPTPPTPEPTENLEAAFTQQGPNTITAPYWRTADFLRVTPENITINNVEEEDGLLNMNQMFNGLSDFNGGEQGEIILKAAYDDDNIYILAEWTDDNYNVSQGSPLYDGPEDPNRATQSHEGWTSQQNDDKIMLAFKMESNKNDLWKWSMAISEPIGYSIDMVVEDGVERIDEGDVLLKRNVDSNRSAPKYEWDGEQQSFVRPLATTTFLDPAFYLLNKTEFTGDIIEGEVLYQEQCGGCHGEDGNGLGPEWQVPITAMTDPTLNRLDRNAFGEVVGSPQHTGSGNWTSLSDTEKDDLMARIRGFSGLPGYYIDEPSLSLPDVQAVSDVNIARVDYYDRDKPNYKVLMVRKLNTGSTDDIQFNTQEEPEVEIEIYLSDNDDVNRVGVRDQKLVFIPKPAVQ